MRILVTAGPTCEPIDPVRVLTNRSSGKMGYAVARAGQARRHEVVLISGPVALDAPAGVRVKKVETAAEMLDAVREAFNWCEALVMAAAVADWRPQMSAGQKLKKHEDTGHLALARTEDILKVLMPLKDDRILIGFAAETEHLVEEAERKMREKRLDMVVANDVSRDDIGFDVDVNQVTLITEANPPQALPVMTKDALGELIIEWLEQRAESRL